MSAKPILCVVGARPNFMKIAPVLRAFESRGIPHYLVHTGQHYDEGMNDRFFAQLGIPEPDVNLGVGSGSHAQQTAEVMRRFEPVLLEQQPAALLVVGDVNSTIACALVAVKEGTPVIHVEAGLRSFDRGMPEEINRILTDQLSELLFTTEAGALDNLRREGIEPARVHFVGNVMIDTLHYNLPRAVAPEQLLQNTPAYDLLSGPMGYAVVTLHRPSNVDRREDLEHTVGTLLEISQRLPLLFPVHPRTAARLREYGLEAMLERSTIHRLSPLGYLEMLGLMSKARLVVTDSGGIQEETTALGVPCVTLRPNTERPITVDHGTNTIVGADRTRALATVDEILTGGGKQGRVPELWDGRAAERIAETLSTWLARPD